MLLTPAEIKPKSFESRRNFFSLFFFLPGVDASHVYVPALALGCFHSLISTHTPSPGLRHQSVISYAYEQFFVGAQTIVIKCVTNNWNKTRRVILWPPTMFTPAQIKPQSFEWRRNSFSLPRLDASHVYVGAWALGCFHSHTHSTRTFRRALTASVDSCVEIKSAPSVA